MPISGTGPRGRLLGLGWTEVSLLVYMELSLKDFGTGLRERLLEED